MEKNNKLHFVEDYISFIAGFVDKNLNDTYFFGSPPVSLARYDRPIVDSFGTQIYSKTALSDKQAQLAQRLISKYRRQLLKLGIDVSEVEVNPEFKFGIRSVDREKRLFIDGDYLIVKFPYDKQIINAVSGIAKGNQGTMSYDRTAKLWRCVPTEYNVSSLYAMAKSWQFEIDSHVEQLMTQIVQLEDRGYAIELVLDKETDQVSITNAATSLIDYVNEHLGGINSANLDRLVDSAGYLGYTVSDDVAYEISVRHGRVNKSLMQNRFAHIANSGKLSSEEVIKKVYKYATLTNRWPVYVYSVNDNLEPALEAVFGKDNVLTTNHKIENRDPVGTCVVLKTSLRRTWDRPIPLLLTTNMVATHSMRSQLAIHAEKIVYYTPSTYNSTQDFDIEKIQL